MTRVFNDTTRRKITELCAGFVRAGEDAAPALKRAAVAIALTENEAKDGAAFLLTRRAAGLRSHTGQWALPGGRCDAGETQAEAALRELHEETTLVAEIDRLLWTGRHNDRPVSYFLMTAVRGRAELSGPEALANRPDNSFELRWVTADRFIELGLHPPDIRGPLTELLAGRPDLV